MVHDAPAAGREVPERDGDRRGARDEREHDDGCRQGREVGEHAHPDHGQRHPEVDARIQRGVDLATPLRRRDPVEVVLRAQEAEAVAGARQDAGGDERGGAVGGRRQDESGQARGEDAEPEGLRHARVDAAARAELREARADQDDRADRSQYRQVADPDLLGRK